MELKFAHYIAPMRLHGRRGNAHVFCNLRGTMPLGNQFEYLFFPSAERRRLCRTRAQRALVRAAHHRAGHFRGQVALAVGDSPQGLNQFATRGGFDDVGHRARVYHGADELRFGVATKGDDLQPRALSSPTSAESKAMDEPTVRFPVVCAKCGRESLLEYPLAIVSTRLKQL